MNTVEKRLTDNLKGTKYILFKYHDKDETDDIPDILDYLYDYEDKLKGELANASLDIYKGATSLASRFRYDRIKKNVSMLKTTIDNVLNSNDTYYVICEADKDTFPQTVSIKESTIPVYSAKLGENRKVAWTEVDSIVKYSLKTNLLEPFNIYDRAGSKTEDKIAHISRAFIGEDGLYIDPQGMDLTYYKCKECGEYFSITDREEAWYISRGLTIPKRCKTCRDAKKKRYSWQE